jgi:hypothetical protein
MKKILIVDDRPMRQKNQLGKDLFDRLCSLDNVTRDTKLDVSDITSYDIIAIHYSLLDNNGQIKEIRDILSKSGRCLILFSGGNPTNRIINSGKEALVSANLFYSKSTIDFFELLMSDNIENHLLEKMLYGKNWKVAFLERYAQLLWVNGATMEKWPETEEMTDDEIQALTELEKEFGHMSFKEINEDINRILKI